MTDGVTDNLDPENLGFTPTQTSRLLLVWGRGERPSMGTLKSVDNRNENDKDNSSVDGSRGSNHSDTSSPSRTPESVLPKEVPDVEEADWAQLSSDRFDSLKKTFIEYLLFDIVTHSADIHSPAVEEPPPSPSSRCLCFFCDYYLQCFPLEFEANTQSPLRTDSVTPFDFEVHLNPRNIVESILRHCRCVTDPGRLRMEKFDGEKLPNDYQKYPGKMDHTTCVCLVVGEYEEGSDMGFNFDGIEVDDEE
jgi:hypothetical protein